MNEIPTVELDASSLTSQTFQRIYSMIIRGELKPGSKLKIEELRKTLGAGASPVREALSLLTSEQLVERIDQRGFRVANISGDAFMELLKTRCWLEERALRESMQVENIVWEERLLLAHHRLKRTPRNLEEGENGIVSNVEWEARHKEFHMAMLSACGSSILIRVCDQLYDQNIRYRNIAGSPIKPQRDVGGEHNAILTHIINHEEDKAVNELVSHYRATGERLSQLLQ